MEVTTSGPVVIVLSQVRLSSSGAHRSIYGN
jgi:hypothetical protein